MSRRRCFVPVNEYDVGTYRELQDKSVVGDGLDIHHIIQAQIGIDMIPNYSEANGVCIALKHSDHLRIRTLRSNEIQEIYTDKSARQILADDIWRNRQSGVVPSAVLLDALRLHLALYPEVYEKQGGQSNAWAILTYMEQMTEQADQRDALEKHVQQLEQRAAACLVNGNRLRYLPAKISELLKNNGMARPMDASDSTGSDTIPGNYTVHQEYDAVLGRNISLKVRIEHEGDETRTKRNGRITNTTITRKYKCIISWE